MPLARGSEGAMLAYRLITLGPRALAELQQIFPDLTRQDQRTVTARTCLRGWEGALVA